MSNINTSLINFNNNSLADYSYIINISRFDEEKKEMAGQLPTEMTPLVRKFDKLKDGFESFDGIIPIDSESSLVEKVLSIDEISSNVASFVFDHRLSYVNKYFHKINSEVSPFILAEQIYNPELAKFLKKEDVHQLLNKNELLKFRNDLRKILKYMKPEVLKNISEGLQPIDAEVKKMLYVITTSQPNNRDFTGLNIGVNIIGIFLCLVFSLGCFITGSGESSSSLPWKITGSAAGSAAVLLFLYTMWKFKDFDQYMEISRIEKKYSLLATSCEILQSRAAQKNISFPNPPVVADGFYKRLQQWFVETQRMYPEISFNRL